MTIQQCVKARAIDSSFDSYFKCNRYKAWKYFNRCLIPIMKMTRPGVRIILHHKNLGCKNYEEFNVNELIPMYEDEHIQFHANLRIGKKASPETLRKMSLSQLGKGKFGIVRSDSSAYHKAAYKAQTPEQKEETLAKGRAYAKERRAIPELREQENKKARERRANESLEKRKMRLLRRKELRALETPEKRAKRLAYNKVYGKKRREATL